MIKEGREIAAIHPNMVVKIPMTVEGLKAVKVLHAFLLYTSWPSLMQHLRMEMSLDGRL